MVADRAPWNPSTDTAPPLPLVDTLPLRVHPATDRDSDEYTPPPLRDVWPLTMDRPVTDTGWSVALSPSAKSNTRLAPLPLTISRPAPGPVIVTSPLLVSSP